jgi:hypothetical protein
LDILLLHLQQEVRLFSENSENFLGMADWLPTYLHRQNGADIDSAGLIVGVVTVIGGLGGTIGGGYIAEKLKVKPMGHSH